MSGPNTQDGKIDFIVAMRCLETLFETGREIKKTHLQNKMNVNSKTFHRHLSWLYSKSYVHIRTNDRYHYWVKITKEGAEALFKFKDINDGKRIEKSVF